MALGVGDPQVVGHQLVAGCRPQGVEVPLLLLRHRLVGAGSQRADDLAERDRVALRLVVTAVGVAAPRPRDPPVAPELEGDRASLDDRRLTYLLTPSVTRSANGLLTDSVTPEGARSHAMT